MNPAAAGSTTATLTIAAPAPAGTSPRPAIRILVVLLSLVAFYFAVVAKFSLVSLLLAAYGGVAQIMPPVLAAFYWRRATRAGALGGLLVGLLVNCCPLPPAPVVTIPTPEGMVWL